MTRLTRELQMARPVPVAQAGRIRLTGPREITELTSSCGGGLRPRPHTAGADLNPTGFNRRVSLLLLVGSDGLSWLSGRYV
jgi:hypothetical protein